MLGFEQCGQFESKYLPDTDMRFYRGSPDHHHDLALVAVPDPASAPLVEPWAMFANRPGVNHVAISYPTREAWLAQLTHMQASGVQFHLRGNHGMTHSAYVSDPDGHGIEVSTTFRPTSGRATSTRP